MTKTKLCTLERNLRSWVQQHGWTSMVQFAPFLCSPAFWLGFCSSSALWFLAGGMKVNIYDSMASVSRQYCLRIYGRKFSRLTSLRLYNLYSQGVGNAAVVIAFISQRYRKCTCIQIDCTPLVVIVGTILTECLRLQRTVTTAS